MRDHFASLDLFFSNYYADLSEDLVRAKFERRPADRKVEGARVPVQDAKSGAAPRVLGPLHRASTGGRSAPLELVRGDAGRTGSMPL